MRPLAWESALAAIDFVVLLVRPSLKALDALEATLLEVTLRLEDFAMSRPPRIRILNSSVGRLSIQYHFTRYTRGTQCEQHNI